MWTLLWIEASALLCPDMVRFSVSLDTSDAASRPGGRMWYQLKMGLSPLPWTISLGHWGLVLPKCPWCSQARLCLAGFTTFDHHKWGEEAFQGHLWTPWRGIHRHILIQQGPKFRGSMSSAFGTLEAEKGNKWPCLTADMPSFLANY